MEKLDVSVNKYYTPTIDEFCVGFRFEVLNNAIWEWQHMNASRLQEINFDDNTDNMSKYRVKYLDKTDIESLGFVDIHKGTDRSSIDRCYKYQLRKIVSNKYEPIPTYRILCNLHYYPDKPGIIYIGGLCDFNIKNKSELVKLLKMLGINE